MNYAATATEDADGDGDGDGAGEHCLPSSALSSFAENFNQVLHIETKEEEGEEEGQGKHS